MNKFISFWLFIVFSSWLFLVPSKTLAYSPEYDIDLLIKTYNLKENSVALRELDSWQKPKKVLVRVDSKERLDWMQEVAPNVELIGVSSSAEALEKVSDVDALLGFCSEELLDKGQQLKWVQIYGVGVDRCLKNKSLLNRNIILSNGKRLSGPQIAEHAIALMFSLTRGLDQYHLAQIKGEWSNQVLPGSDAIWELSGRTMLVVGLGGIGTEVARRGHALGMKVIATRNSSRTGPDFVSYVGLSSELNKLASQADVVINTVPLTKTTEGIFNNAFFKAMKNNAYFISIGRGKSTNADDLLAALIAGELAGAGLDVTDPEPLPEGHALWKQPRVIITPHIAWRSEKYSKRVWLVARENLRRYVAGEALLSQVDLLKGY
ncbi:MAG: hypothetical protein COA74_00070 [Gammaproteobacteria bacterium]|nr:MAG: hypothetical protein COA74_00070 [Gammaproteobacteria bacterium]